MLVYNMNIDSNALKYKNWIVGGDVKKLCCYFLLFKMIDPQNGSGVKFVNIMDNVDCQAVWNLMVKFYLKMVLHK